MKTRTARAAALFARPALWSSDDCETARLSANQTARPWGLRGPTPEQAWDRRRPFAEVFRRCFQEYVHIYEKRESGRRGWLPGLVSSEREQAKIRRAAVRNALCACGLLVIRRRSFTLPFSPVFPT